MIIGFNTDIEHDGVVYHVQTEDKGVNSPLILSLVYSGGTILASKRSPYEDLIAAGFNEEVLAERLKRQHRLICAAINAGRLEELKRMSARDVSAPSGPALPADEVEKPPQAPPADEPIVESEHSLTEKPAEEAVIVRGKKDSPYTVYDSRRKVPVEETDVEEEGLVLSLISEEEFRAGESFSIKLQVQQVTGNSVKQVPGAALSVKILGTTFRPQLYATKTGRDGVAEVSVDIPNFSSGRAAILVRAALGGESKELRRVIHPAG